MPDDRIGQTLQQAKAPGCLIKKAKKPDVVLGAGRLSQQSREDNRYLGVEIGRHSEAGASVFVPLPVESAEDQLLAHLSPGADSDLLRLSALIQNGASVRNRSRVSIA